MPPTGRRRAALVLTALCANAFAPPTLPQTRRVALNAKVKTKKKKKTAKSTGGFGAAPKKTTLTDEEKEARAIRGAVRDATTALEEVRDQEGEAQAWLKLGAVLVRGGEFSEAERVFARGAEKFEGEEMLKAAKSVSGYQHLSLNPDDQTATLALNGMQLDLGGIAKGYAADLIFEHLKNAGYNQTLVAAAGDIRLGDAPPDKEGWGIALRTFRLTPSEPMFLKNCAISTSGDLYQNVQIGKNKYSHLIDPKTGLGMTSRRAASVIAPFAQLTDPLATAACLIDEPAQLANIRPDLSLRILYEDPNIQPVVTGAFLAN